MVQEEGDDTRERREKKGQDGFCLCLFVESV